MKNLAAVLALLLLCSGCPRAPRQPLAPGPEAKDDLGRIVRLPRPASRIVSLAPSLTESLFALGLDSSVVGVTSYCNYPPEARQRTSVGGMSNPSIERIAALSPDLVIMTVLGNTRADFDRLEQLGIPVFVSNPESIDGVKRCLRALGVLGGCAERGDFAAQRLAAELSALEKRAVRYPPTTLLILVSLRPLIAAARGTYLDELARLANATNVLASSSPAFPLTSPEEILAAKPEWILTTTDVLSEKDELSGLVPHLASLEAVRTGKVLLLDADLVSRPGPRVSQALESIITRLEEHAKATAVP